MASQISDEALGSVILHSVTYSSYPDSEDVASAELPPSALPNLQKVLEEAREDIKKDIRVVSREAAPDIDGWIAQAKQLQADIQDSKATARAIVQAAEEGQKEAAKAHDAGAKVVLLENELVFNETLVNIVEQMKHISAQVEAAQDDAVQSRVSQALDKLGEIEEVMKKLGTFSDTRVAGLLQSKANVLRRAITENATECWNALLVPDPSVRKIIIKDKIQRETLISIEMVVEVLKKLRLFDTAVGRFAMAFESIIISPRLSITRDPGVLAIKIDEDDIQAKGGVKSMSVHSALEDIHRIAEYLSTRLPPSIAVPLSAKLVPVIATKLINNWLVPAVPLHLKDIPAFQETLSLVLGLAEYLDELTWSSQSQLVEWVDSSAELWLAKRKEATIAGIRRVCFKGVLTTHTVERVETQMVSKSDDIITGNEAQDDDWGADWGEEDTTAEESKTAESVDEEDVSAWGVDDDTEEETPKPESKEASEPGEDEADAWGWDDEDVQAAPTDASPKLTKSSKANGASQPQQPVSREITLKETYVVTSIPDAILEIINQVMSDVDALSRPPLSTTAIAPAGPNLYAMPSLVLAMYRATASTHYQNLPAGNMLIYNDCMRLSSRLTNLLTSLPSPPNPIGPTTPPHLHPTLLSPLRLSIESSIKKTDSLAHRAYGREMEAQRTIVRDLLDGAQGFGSCTAAPFAGECANAITMTVDRIREVAAIWKIVLSRSVRLQSLGSLLSAAITKVITEIEELPDIPEEESRKLRGFCMQLGELSSLFIADDEAASGTDGQGDAQQRDLTSIYTPNWFKFQYLAEILDASLADIKYFWQEGELRLEMEKEEVVDLIKALFADSEHRRRAIQEIRR
ncbi:uncharacterized protein BDZ99DRAFT_575515 [Mytilinidion resinicola]|uniref:ZW10 C-terminal helical domain-containing protein n=1 Tax=Mytilinidion resinicola TaxID=574789 RepID=A0A6A6Y814_9PEZI|nr:uncharacterized protein BDZ99DRAFT_575515 [Mytilinidion resinicola]KAF2804285.1 hypothetical protein BDZ99DRAFT_575515 [Mytilinidion resinicola]